MLHLILWGVGLWIFFGSGLGVLCLYLLLRILGSGWFWVLGYLFYVWAKKV